MQSARIWKENALTATSPPSPEKERKKGILSQSQTSVTQHESMLLSWSGFMGSQFHRNAQDLPCVCPVSFKPAHALPSEVGLSWEHLCYLWNTLAKNNPAHRIRLFYTCLLSTDTHITWPSGLEPAAMGFPVRQPGQSRDLAGTAWQTQLSTTGQKLERLV